MWCGQMLLDLLKQVKTSVPAAVASADDWDNDRRGSGAKKISRGLKGLRVKPASGTPGSPAGGESSQKL